MEWEGWRAPNTYGIYTGVEQPSALSAAAGQHQPLTRDWRQGQQSALLVAVGGLSLGAAGCYLVGAFPAFTHGIINHL